MQFCIIEMGSCEDKANIGFKIFTIILFVGNTVMIAINNSGSFTVPEVYFEVFGSIVAALPVLWSSLLWAFNTGHKRLSRKSSEATLQPSLIEEDTGYVEVNRKARANYASAPVYSTPLFCGHQQTLSSPSLAPLIQQPLTPPNTLYNTNAVFVHDYSTLGHNVPINGSSNESAPLIQHQYSY